jgi:hypothetical protein
MDGSDNRNVRMVNDESWAMNNDDLIILMILNTEQW